MTNPTLFFPAILLLLMTIGLNLKAQTVNSDSVLSSIEPTPHTLTVDTSNFEETIITLPINQEEIPCYNQYPIWNNEIVRIKKKDLQTLIPAPVNINLLNHGDFVFPFKGKAISPYGYRGKSIHTGIDIKLTKGDTVKAAFDGVVRLSKRSGAYGKMVVIRHYNGLETIYSHLSKLMANVNQKVVAGEVIGLGGRTGRASTDHLHFETRYLEEPFNPQHLLDFTNYSLYDSTLIIVQKTFKMRSKPFHRKGLPAEEYEDDGPRSDSLDTLYAHNWIWPTPKATDTLDAKDSLATATSDPKKNLKQDSSAIKNKSTVHLELDDKITIQSNNKTHPQKQNPSQPQKETLASKKNTTIIPSSLSNRNHQPHTHTVAPKETLYSISKRYKITVDKLREANRLPKESTLSIGQVLIIPNA